MWSYVPKLHVFFYLTVLLSDFFLYIEPLQRHLVRWSSLDTALQLQGLNFYLRCFGAPGSASANVRFINDVKKQIA